VIRSRRCAVTIAVTAATMLGALAACSSSGNPAPLSSSPQSPGAPASFQTAHRGGTLNIAASSAPGTLDPQISYDNAPWQIAQAVYDGLVAFKKVGGAQSLTIVPDLATKLPIVTNGGKTYTFTLRQGIRFANGQALTTVDVLASFRRIYKASGPTAGTFFQNIVGAADCLRSPDTCALPGVTANAATGTVVIQLTQPDAQLLDKLALPHAAIVPGGTPNKDQGIKPISGTGAYLIASYDPNSQLTLKRNPYFKVWSQDAQPEGYPDEIHYRYGLTVDAEVTGVENGQIDWMNDTVPTERLNEIGTKYAGQVHINPLPAFWYLPLNVNIPPFNNLKARQALEWAVDRRATADLYGGPSLATPVCTILPPSFPEHVNFCDYTRGGGTTWAAPDVVKAKELVQQSGTAGQPVAIVVANDATNLAIGQYLQSLLSQIGYQATLKPLSGNIQFTYIQNSKNRVQISLTQWYEDYPAASDFINVLLSCASFHPGSDSSINMGGYCDHSFDAKIDQAMRDDQTDPNKAKTEWGELDRQAMSQALLVPLFTPKSLDFVGRRVGNYQFTTEVYMLIDQLWVK
jgi:peptide/nickel transport system substrate-binding protein